MNVPAFAAESTLYKSARHYAMGGIPRSSLDGIIPAQQDREFCRPGCSTCTEIAPGQWQQGCINPACGERTQSCTPNPICGSCVPDPTSSTGYSEQCWIPGAINPARFNTPCMPASPLIPPECDTCSWWQWPLDPVGCAIREANCRGCSPFQYVECLPWMGFCRVFCAQSTDRDRCYRGCLSARGCENC